MRERKKERKKYIFFSLWGQMREGKKNEKKRKCFFFFLSFSHNLSELSLIPIWTRELGRFFLNKILSIFYLKNFKETFRNNFVTIETILLLISS